MSAGHAGNQRLGEFLRARRGLVRPEDVGLSGNGRRRVPGLRREELAMLAGISPDYYMRLEQARDVHPSGQVLDSIARALQLDVEGTAYLHQLNRGGRLLPRQQSAETVSPGLGLLVRVANELPLFVLGRLRDVLVINRLASALLPILRPGTNHLRAMFLDPNARSLYRDWEAMAATTVAHLRATAADWSEDDDALVALVRELSDRSETFKRLWATHEVRVRPTDIARFDHPVIGPLQLHYELLTSLAADGQVLVVYHSGRHPPGREALAALKQYAFGSSKAARRDTDALPETSSLSA
ncbi:MAG TPA: helix-turn-helix transcriptional regulator [Acidimicrobiales bacterium]|nr:helix-turn-helix transcriptional regulator [Acidimicrobiales bacterium]